MMQTANHPAQRTESGRVIRFAMVGITGTVIDFVLLAIFKSGFGFSTGLSNTLSYSAGIFNNYALNRIWTFRESRSKNVFAQFAQFAAVSLIGLLLNDLLVLILEAPFGTLLSNPQAGYLPAKITATALVMVWNFLANRLWTFNDLNDLKSTTMISTLR